MTNSDQVTPPVDSQEWELRKQLADFYHLVYFMGWAELLFNHISVRLPGTEEYLVNPFGLHYTEITPENLIVVGMDGTLRRQSPYPANPAGFALHGAVHHARHDINCIAHTHTTHVAAVVGKKAGFSHNNFYGAQLVDRIGYHAFEGITLYEGERERMVASLGAKNILVLRNHGIAVCERDVPTTFMLLWTVHRAAEVQCQADSMKAEDIVLSEDIRESCRRDAAELNRSASYAKFAFDGQVRVMRRTLPATW
jgi:ribulose-5-phosphate 4-epimerase/fuculose-1-phosphate aldolase